MKIRWMKYLLSLIVGLSFMTHPAAAGDQETARLRAAIFQGSPEAQAPDRPTDLAPAWMQRTSCTQSPCGDPSSYSYCAWAACQCQWECDCAGCGVESFACPGAFAPSVCNCLC